LLPGDLGGYGADGFLGRPGVFGKPGSFGNPEFGDGGAAFAAAARAAMRRGRETCILRVIKYLKQRNYGRYWKHHPD